MFMSLWSTTNYKLWLGEVEFYTHINAAIGDDIAQNLGAFATQLSPLSVYGHRQ